jgi:hypothetical protein
MNSVRWLVALCFAALISAVSAQTNAPLTAKAVAEKLYHHKHAIAEAVTRELQQSNFTASYTTVWRAYEDAGIAALTKILPEKIPGLTAANFDAGKSGREKNRLADLALRVEGQVIEISIKAARKSANPENDMGTFHEHPEREQVFADSFTLWVRYDDVGEDIRCDRAFFDRTWRMTGQSSQVDGVKYRKKDGNMRPKPWGMFESGAAFWSDEAAFEAAVQRAEKFRAGEIVNEHLSELDEPEQRALYERLREKFAADSSTNLSPANLPSPK